jgi:hypothetical protein
MSILSLSLSLSLYIYIIFAIALEWWSDGENIALLGLNPDQAYLWKMWVVLYSLNTWSHYIRTYKKREHIHVTFGFILSQNFQLLHIGDQTF